MQGQEVVRLLFSLITVSDGFLVDRKRCKMIMDERCGVRVVQEEMWSIYW